MGRATLSEHGAATQFATVDAIRLSFAWLPLLRGRLAVDRVEVKGAQARLVRLADGSTNVDDLTAARPKGGAGLAPAPASTKTSTKTSTTAPTTALGFAVTSIRIDNARLVLDDRRAGRVVDVSRLNFDSGPLAHGVPSRIALSANVGLDRPAINSAVILSSSFTFDRDTRRIAFTALDLNLDATLRQAGTHAVAKLAGTVDIDLAKNSADVVFKGRLDDANVDLKGASHGGVLRLALDIDQLDLDRYRARPAPSTLAPPAVPAPLDAPIDTEVDLSALATLRAGGNLHIGALKVAGMHLTGVDAVLRADAGKVALEPVLATLYGGRGKGTLTLDYGANPATPTITFAQNLDGVELGPLLRDALGKAPLSGRGAMALRLRTQGASVLALRQAMQGNASLRLADGSLGGFNLPQVVRDVATAGGVADSAAKTDFSELHASFAIVDGVARNDDLLVKTALLRIAGAGEIDLARAQIDYTLMCSALPTAQGQDGPDAGTLKAVTVPVKLSGPFDAIAWRIDTKALGAAPAVQKLKEKVRDKIRDKLRGWLH